MAIPFDRYQRFKAVADLINSLQSEGLTILDVGSYDDVFARFLPMHRVISVDKESGIDGTALPYRDNEFDVTVSLDVLEHVSPPDRRRFIRELLRVASRKCFLAVPMGPQTAEAERLVYLLTKNPWLKEHLENGLPTEEEVESIFREAGVSWKKHPNGSLASWFSMIILNHLPNKEMVDAINIFFNKNFYPHENREPSYRVIYEIDLCAKPSSPVVAPPVRYEASIIIPAYNRLELTRRCLEVLAQNTPDTIKYEVIVVDNASTDGTCQFLQGLQGDVKVILNEENQGFARACNQGAAVAEGEYLVFLNNDTEPLPGWLEALLEAARSRERVGAVGCKLLFPDGTVQHAGVGIARDVLQGVEVAPYHIYYRMNPNAAEVNKERSLQVVTAACMLVPRSVFQEVGGFDESYYNGYEDVDLCFRLRERGYQVLYTPRAQLIHHESASGPERFRKVQHNVELLNRRWKGRVAPDDQLIYLSDGLVARYEPDGRGSYVRKLLPLGKTSLIVLTRNQLKYTRLCLESVFQYTSLPFELILVDNGSTDGTLPCLQKLARERENVRLIANADNLGFAVGNNQGLAAASGEYIVFLNNDCVVTEGWLERLLACLESVPGAGAVGPCSNYVVGPQLVPQVPYAPEDLAAMHAFARRFSEQNKGSCQEVERVIGFCLLTRREAIHRIGGFDPRFASGNFEDDDFCLRLRLAGYRILIARDTFVHHFGSRTFAGERIDYQKVMEENWARFREKWGIPERQGAERGYIPAQVLSRTVFDPERHRVPIPGEGREVTYFTLIQPEDEESWRGPLSWYLGRHKPGDRSTLILGLQAASSGALEALYQKIEAFLRERWQAAPDEIPDVTVAPASEDEWRKLAGQADFLLACTREQKQLLAPLAVQGISLQHCPETP